MQVILDLVEDQDHSVRSAEALIAVRAWHVREGRASELPWSALDRGVYNRPMTTVLKMGDLEARVGQEIGVSPWLEITQDRIDLFAKATEDFQWIHVDPERAKQSPFGSTIAHGFLTLSLLPKLTEEAFAIAGRKMGINYGLNKVRFTSPVPVGAKIRGRFTLAKLEPLAGGVQTTWNVVVEREGAEKPVMVAETISRHYF
jgi:acyl dehydratase